jgi:hypothetical protein
MVNRYLNLKINDPKIADTINKLRKHLKSSTPKDKFKSAVIELDNISSSFLSEQDDMSTAKIFRYLNRKCSAQIEFFKNDRTPINGQTFGELMQIYDER